MVIFRKIIIPGLKVMAWVFFPLILISIILYLGFVSPRVQTYLAGKAAQYLSGHLKTEVSVKGVDIDFFSKVVLEGVYLQDLHKDTLISAGFIRVDLLDFFVENPRLDLSSIELQNTKFFLRQYQGEPDLNLQFIIDALSSSDTSTGPGKGFSLFCREVRLKNVTFGFRDFDFPLSQKGGVDYTNLRMDEINADFRNLSLLGDSLRFTMKSFQCKEQSGFILDNLSCKALVCGSRIECHELDLTTKHSHVKGTYAMAFNSFKDFKEYEKKVYMTSVQLRSLVSFEDLCFFAPDLKGLKEQVTVTGAIRGTVERLKAKDLRIELPGGSRIIADVSVSGLPDIETTFFDVKAKNIETGKKALEKIPLPPFSNREFLALPDIISKFGLISFQGNVSGFINDFVAFGKISTSLGKIETDLNLKFTGEDSTSTYQGKISTAGFDLGHLLDLKTILGKITFSTKIKGSGYSPTNAVVEQNGEVASIFFNGYSYADIHVEGKTSKGLYSGILTCRDPNLDFDFEGDIDYRGPEPAFHLSSNIRYARPEPLNLWKLGSNPLLATKLNLNFIGNDLDHFNGSFSADSFSFSSRDGEIISQKITLVASQVSGGRTLHLRSDLLDASLEGVFLPESVPFYFTDFLKTYFHSLPDYSGLWKSELKKPNFYFEVRIKDFASFEKWFLPEISIAKGTYISGKLDHQGNDLSYTLHCPNFKYSDIEVSAITGSGQSGKGQFKVDLATGEIKSGPTVQIPRIEFHAGLRRDSSAFSLGIAEAPGAKYHAGFEGIFLPNESGGNIRFGLSNIFVDSEPWALEIGSMVGLSAIGTTYKNVRFQKNEQLIELNGALPFKPNPFSTESVLVDLKSVELDNTDWFLNSMSTDLGGHLNGSLKIEGSFQNPFFGSGLNVKNFSFNNDTLGDLGINATFLQGDSSISVLASLGKDSIKTISALGKVNLFDAKNYLDLNIDFSRTYLNKFANYLEDYTSDLKGIASGNLHLGGTFKTPVLNGTVTLQKASFGIDYLNTRYNLAHTFQVNDSTISFKGLILNDEKGNIAIANGSLKHHHFKDFVLDISLLPKNFQVLGTTAGMNSIYFGKAFGSGLVTIKGPADEIEIRVSLKTDKGTKLSIPLSNPNEIADNYFITFTNSGKADTSLQSFAPKLEGLKIFLELEVTPEADLELIFDSKIGDIIRTNGSGAIRMDILSSGDFSMFGEYLIERGDYLFTLRNVINKKFTVEKGGMIRWNGDPMQAEVQLNAVYGLRARLYDLILDDSDEFLKRRIPVECHLKMTDKLLNPTIQFDIKIPELERGQSTYADLVRYYTSTEEQRTSQVMSLLLMRRFFTPVELSGSTTSNGGGQEVSSNSVELLNNQLNNWVSKVSNKWDLGVNVTDEDLGASIGKGFFNDRILIDGGVKYSSSTSASQTTTLVGDAMAEIKLSRDGRYRFKYYYSSNAATNIYENGVSKQGAAFSYRTEFDNFSQLSLFRKKVKNISMMEKKNFQSDEPPALKPD